MNNIFAQRLSFLLSWAVLVQLAVPLPVISSGLPIRAETVNTGKKNESAKLAVREVSPRQISNAAPIPGTTITSAAALTTASTNNQKMPPATTDSEVAQIDVDPGIPTRGGSSYVGIAGNIGLDGETALGDGSFAIISKIGFTNTLSARPAAVIGDNTTFLIPVTYDFSILPTDAFAEAFPISPYVGGGIALSTGGDDDDDDSDSNVGLLLSGGVDFPFSSQFTATAAVNAAFFGETDIGLLIGVGYNFTEF